MIEAGVISIDAVREVQAYLSRTLIENHGVSTKAGLSEASLEERGSIVPLASFTSMLETAAYESGDTIFGINLGRKYRIAALGPVGDLVRTARTLGEGLEKFTRLFCVHQTKTVTGLSVSNGLARMSYSIADKKVRSKIQDAGLTMAIEYWMLSSLLGKHWKPVAIDFEHSAGADLSLYKQHFVCELRFGRGDNALIFPSGLLETPLHHDDAAIHRQVEADLSHRASDNAARLDLEDAIEAWLTESLCLSLATNIENAASDFGMTARTFQRLLAERSITYLELRNRTRIGVAKCMLAETNMPVTSIALHLGYSEGSALSRSFRTQTGSTPAEFRRCCHRA